MQKKANKKSLDSHLNGCLRFYRAKYQKNKTIRPALQGHVPENAMRMLGESLLNPDNLPYVSP